MQPLDVELERLLVRIIAVRMPFRRLQISGRHISQQLEWELVRDDSIRSDGP